MVATPKNKDGNEKKVKSPRLLWSEKRRCFSRKDAAQKGVASGHEWEGLTMTCMDMPSSIWETVLSSTREGQDATGFPKRILLPLAETNLDVASQTREQVRMEDGGEKGAPPFSSVLQNYGSVTGFHSSSLAVMQSFKPRARQSKLREEGQKLQAVHGAL